MPPAKFTHAEQEKLILDAAAQCIEETSLIDFKMSAIAKKAGLSMGSVYKHIQSKEDVLVALAVKMGEKVSSTICDIMDMPYSLQARLIQLQLVDPNKMYSYSFGQQLFMILNNEDLLAKASTRWLKEFLAYNDTIGQKIMTELNKAIETQQLVCQKAEREDLLGEIMIAHWAIDVGYPLTVYHDSAKRLIGQEVRLPYPLTIDAPIIRASIRLMNAFPWKEQLDIDELKALKHEFEQQLEQN